ncbi:Signal transduction histidine kinase [Neorhodopirellula lusitana]|uniref:Signal transduction histidine kinase n=1 Tax=Neorhodopirellula lusitana TaxID=445327 RepID=A0ABY1PS99_9BACT|nr:sensor histidine kinase [Neorhodopirellula lusitana]SMP43265.1 Signal transduction histidine kinase [Neorhodopirellula lusitana]
MLILAARSSLGQTSDATYGVHDDRRVDRLHSDAWGPDDGLPSDQVFDILQTQDGYLWIGTGAGLSRFDGVKFENFDQGNTPELTSKRVTLLYESSDGTLWVGSEQGGLIAFQTGRQRTAKAVRELAGKSIRSIRQDFRGALWVGTDSGTWRSQAGEFEEVAAAPKQVWSLAEDKDHVLWMGGPDGLFRWDDTKSGAVKMEAFSLAGTNPAVNVLVADRDGSLWAGTEKAGLIHFKDEILSRILPNSSIQSVYQDRLGVIWYAGKSGKLKRLNEQETVSANPPWFGIGVSCIADDREGGLWLGANGSPHCLRQLKPASAVSFDHVAACVMAAPDGGVWLGSNAGLAHVAARSGPETLTVDRYYRLTRALAFAAGRNESLWVGQRTKGISHFVDHGLSTDTARDGLRNEPVGAILEDRAGSVWVGYVDGGAARLDGDRFVELGAFRDLTVHWFAELSNGDVYAGTNNGLYRGTERVGDPLLDELPSTEFRSHYLDDVGDLWLGTLGDGLCRMREGAFTNWRVSDGLLANRIFAITDDPAGNLWLGSLDKVFYVPKRSLDELATGKVDQLDCRLMPLSIEGQRLGQGYPKMTRSNDGSVWVTRKRDTVKIPPGAIDISQESAPVHIEDVRVDGVALAGHDRVEFQSGIHRLEIHYTVATYAQPHAAKFRYRMPDHVEDWIEAGDQRVAHFTELPPGSYTFQVQVVIGDGVWNDEVATIAIVVRPRWFETTWFKILLATGLCSTLIISVLVYTSRVRHHNAQLQKEITERKEAEAILQKHQTRLKALASELTVAEERERRRIAADLHDDVGQTLALARIQLASARKSMSSLELGAKLDTLSSTILKATQDTRHLVYDLSSPSLNELGLDEAIEEWLEEEIGNRFGLKTQIVRKSQADAYRDAISDDVRALIFRSVRELLVNVVKHANATSVVVTTEYTGDQIVIAVEDDGVGFDAGAEAFRVSSEGGFGLFSIQERMMNLGGSMEIESEPGMGSCARLFVPCVHSDSFKTEPEGQ